MIYLDNAATTVKKPQAVVNAVTEALTSFGNASRGAHEWALASLRAVYEARVKTAALFGCPQPDHVAFTANATEALNIAIRGSLEEGSHVITTVMEHNSVLRPLYLMEKERGVELSIATADRKGRVDLNEIRSLIRPGTKAIVLGHGSNLTGGRIDLSAVGMLAREHGLLFIVDAAQTAGAVPINMQEAGISILCFTGHKSMMGPQGTGGLCLMPDVELKPFKVGGSGVQSYLKTQPEEYPTRLEAGTLNAHGIAGLSAAIDFINETGIETIEAHERRLSEQFRNAVRNISGVTVYGDPESPDYSPIVSLNIADLDSAIVADELAVSYGIAVRAGAHCAPLAHRALGTETQGAVRFSFGWFNTEEEVTEAAKAVEEIAGRHN